jgi:hypothetical protein
MISPGAHACGGVSVCARAHISWITFELLDAEVFCMLYRTVFMEVISEHSCETLCPKKKKHKFWKGLLSFKCSNLYTKDSRNYNLIIIQFSDSFLYIISTNTCILTILKLSDYA